MGTDAESAGDGAEHEQADTAAREDAAASPPDPGLPGEQEAEVFPHFVEVWNDYDPSQRFAAIFPVGEKEGAQRSSVAYYIIEPGKHTGVHSDNAEEVSFVAEGEGEVFMIGASQRLEAGKFVVFPAGSDHDIYAQGAVALRLLSFFPTTEIVSTFQQVIFPVASTVLTSKPPPPTVLELDPDNLPENFPFTLEELGMAGGESEEASELTETQRLLGMTAPGVPPREVKTTIYTPGENKVEEFVTYHDAPETSGDEAGAAEAPPDEAAPGEET
jgi:quercetin dioxygenase-like cupin family protein